MMTWFTPCSWPPGGGYSWEILVGVWRPVLQILTSFRTIKCHFRHPFLGKSGRLPVFSRFIFVFALSQFSGPTYLGAWNRLGLIRQKLCHHYQIRAQTKNSPNAFRIRTFLFRSYSFGIETINTSIHVRSHSSLENHTQFQTKIGKGFSDQKGPKTLPFGRYIPIWLKQWSTPVVLTPFMIVRDRDQV